MMSAQTRDAIAMNSNSLKYSARGSHGSGAAIEHSSSHKRSSSEIFPEPPPPPDTHDAYTFGHHDN